MRKPSKQDAEAFMYAALVECQIDLAQEWQGWRIRGRVLITPDGDRIPVGRLLWLLRRESLKSAVHRQTEAKPSTVVPFPIARRASN